MYDLSEHRYGATPRIPWVCFACTRESDEEKNGVDGGLVLMLDITDQWEEMGTLGHLGVRGYEFPDVSVGHCRDQKHRFITRIYHSREVLHISLEGIRNSKARILHPTLNPLWFGRPRRCV